MSLRMGLNILLVDDDPRCLGTLEDFLEVEGHRTVTALRGEEALSIAREWSSRNPPFELSILDLHVPDMDGIETYERLTGLLPRLGAIFISGDLTAANAHSIYAAGGFRAMGKPVDIGEMRQAIEDYRRVLATEARACGGTKRPRAVRQNRPATAEESLKERWQGSGVSNGSWEELAAGAARLNAETRGEINNPGSATKDGEGQRSSSE